MKFAHSRDMEVPVDYAFGRASDFASFEQRLSRSGGEVHRLSGGPFVPGYRWQIAGLYRNKPRQAEITLKECRSPDRIAVLMQSGGFEVTVKLALIGLNQVRCKVEAELVLRAKTLRARLLLPGVRLARDRIARRLRSEMNDIAKRAEVEFRAGR